MFFMCGCQIWLNCICLTFKSDLNIFLILCVKIVVMLTFFIYYIDYSLFSAVWLLWHLVFTVSTTGICFIVKIFHHHL